MEDANASALRVFAGMFNKADGMISEVMAGQIWKVLHDKPVFMPKYKSAGDEIIEILEKSERVFNGRLLILTSQVRPRLGFRT